MSEPKAILGAWVPIRDVKSARYAIRMSSLPLLFMGLFSFLIAFVALEKSDGTLLIFCGLLGLFCSVVSLVLRAGYCLFLIPVVSVSLVSALVYYAVKIKIFPMLLFLMMFGLSISGLRGWVWMYHRNWPE